MGEIADAMMNGELCAMCGEGLECEVHNDCGFPAYCSRQCAKDAGATIHQVCKNPC